MFFFFLNFIVFAQHCEQNATLPGSPFGSIHIGVVDTTAPFCFICGYNNVYTFSLVGVVLTNSTYYYIDPSINALVINNWTNLTFDSLQPIIVECVIAGIKYPLLHFGGTFFSSRKLILIV